MKPLFVTLFLGCFSIVAAQSPDLSRHHSILTTDCKSIRGHAGRIVAEASESSFNRDVAAAHLEQIESYHSEMRERLQVVRRLLSQPQWKQVEREYQSLETTCSILDGYISALKKEFGGENPDKDRIRELAVKLRSEMSGGYDVHERMKKKLGIL